jgi:hypothetical protein
MQVKEFIVDHNTMWATPRLPNLIDNIVSGVYRATFDMKETGKLWKNKPLKETVHQKCL